MDYISGEILVVDKPYRWTSFDAVKRLRGAVQRRLNAKRFKVGHAGTLDPLATGVLLVCTGRATKRIAELQEGMKEYVAEITFGATTPSYDLEKEIDATYPWEHITPELIAETLPKFQGHVMQVPPVFSAVKAGRTQVQAFGDKGTRGAELGGSEADAEGAVQQRHLHPRAGQRFRRSHELRRAPDGPETHQGGRLYN